MQSGWLDEEENSQVHVDTVKTQYTYVHAHTYTKQSNSIEYDSAQEC